MLFVKRYEAYKRISISYSEEMSWPSIWQTPSQAQGTGSASGAQAPAMNMGGMYQLTAEQQYALQQQNWQQWQVYQTQLAQWQAQYGERVRLNTLSQLEHIHCCD